MSLTLRDVEKIAHLARLQIDESDVPEYTKNLSNILDLISQMQSIDTSEVEPLAHPFDAVQRLRADVITEQDQREHLQKAAPAVENGLFLVPKVIE